MNLERDDAEPTTGHTHGPPGCIRSQSVFHGRIVDLSLDTVRFPDGSMGELEMIRHSGAAAVLPIIGEAGSDDPEVVLIRQYRYAAGGHMLEVPAGRPDRPGEDWGDCARRELEEETGLVAGRLVPLTSGRCLPGARAVPGPRPRCRDDRCPVTASVSGSAGCLAHRLLAVAGVHSSGHLPLQSVLFLVHADQEA
jgi:8-oxo-dGTP pyrophosphatase MutT (NUDIX family)